MAMVDVDGSNPNRLAWSDSRQPLKLSVNGCTLAMVVAMMTASKMIALILLRHIACIA